jgi:AraC-like DNA-binding protein
MSMAPGSTSRPTSPYRSIAAGFVRGLADFAVSRGARMEEILRESGIDSAALRERENRIPFARYVALMNVAKISCDDPALALHFGEAVDMAELSILPSVGGRTATMDDVVAQMNRYAPLDLEIDGVAERLQLSVVDGHLWMVDTRPDPNDFPELTEAAFARIVCGVRRLLGPTRLVNEVHVTHPQPAYKAEYDRIFGAPVLFESDRNALLMADGLWPAVSEAMVSRISPYASDVLSAHADALLESLEKSKSTRGRVEAILRSILHTGEARLQTIANTMGVSRQTLFRRLRAEGVTFQRVLDELRHRMAVDYLDVQKMPVNETAYLLGFSDAAAFSRAFKRWTGSSPRSARDGRTK